VKLVHLVGFITKKKYEFRVVFIPSLADVDPSLPLCLKSKINVFVSGHNFIIGF
jgi:hypothetical protein